MRELENGSTATKLWKDVKRKRVRIPDLVCVRCGLRVESRAKSRHPVLSVSHSEADEARKWDFGLVPSDVVAFPTCERQCEAVWSAGRLDGGYSYWHSRDRAAWRALPFVNYARVARLRTAPFVKLRPKGVTEGSEVAIRWDAVFSTRAGVIENVTDGNVRVRGEKDGRAYTARNAKALPVHVAIGDHVSATQVLAADVLPETAASLACTGSLAAGHIEALLKSPERTQRFTGLKLARLCAAAEHCATAEALVHHPDEDIYVKLEAAAYLARVCHRDVQAMFGPYLLDSDDQIRLETVVALAAAATPAAVELLGKILSDVHGPYFLRSAAAWALGEVETEGAVDKLIQAFVDTDLSIRGDALEAFDSLSDRPYAQLTKLLVDGNDDESAGAAEALRRYGSVPEQELQNLVGALTAGAEKEWIVWLLGNLPRGVDYVDAAVAEVQQLNPRVHFALSVLWSFLRSWIAPLWELHPYARPR